MSGKTDSKPREILLSPGVASPALGLPVHDRHGVNLAKGQDIDQIIGLSNMGGEAERIEIAELHDKAQRDLAEGQKLFDLCYTWSYLAMELVTLLRHCN
ncbi:hypothetical protein TURU_115472 [Turdus rufiventris]|nr:hypothetical protein TURU_115472 [Turdus rufiventris]